MEGLIGRPPTKEHTFRTGRSATVREVLSAIAVFDDPVLAEHAEDFEHGTIRDATVAVAITRKVVGMMLVHPRLAGDGLVADGEEVVALEDLYQDEINELLDMWQENVKGASTFRGESDGPNRAARRAGVGAAAKPRAGTRTRKS